MIIIQYLQMKNSNASINPIGLVDDFSELFEEVCKIETSSDNWFQQYRVKSAKNRVEVVLHGDSISDSFWLLDIQNDQSSSKKQVLPLSNEEFCAKYKQLLFYAINKSAIFKGEDNEMSILFKEMYTENKIASLNVLNELYISNIDNDMFCVKILSLCNDYSEQDLYPTAQVLASLSINHKSDRVKSAAMNLFSHWGTKDAYRLLCSITCPEAPWIKMKYETIKKALERRWCMQER